LASSSIWEAVQTMTALDSATGRTLDRSFSMTTLQELKAVSLAGGLSCRTQLSRLLEPRLLLYVPILGLQKINHSRVSYRLPLEKRRILVVTCLRPSVEYTSVSYFSTSVEPS
jgi:hypothetical protein